MHSSNVTPRAGRGAKIGRIELHVLCSGTWDAAPSLLLTIERKETHGYLINCGDGTMRFCAEHHMRLSTHLSRVLLTRQTWECIGGLPDVLLTRFAEQEKYSEKGSTCRTKVHGLSRLTQLIGSFHDFVRREALPRLQEQIAELSLPDPKVAAESGTTATAGSPAASRCRVTKPCTRSCCVSPHAG